MGREWDDFIGGGFLGFFWLWIASVMPLAKRTRNLFDSASTEPFKLSRSRLENFLKCPRCFYLDRRMGIDQPSMPAFTLNVAVDHLLKKEFDVYRAKGEPHPLMKEGGVEAVPFQHSDLDIWRANFKGIAHLHTPTNLIIHWRGGGGQILILSF